MCKQRLFQELIPLIRRECAGMSERDAVERIGELTGCGRGCGTCRPYLRLVVRTGQYVLPVLSEREARALDPER